MALTEPPADSVAAFIKAAVWHPSAPLGAGGSLDEAGAILAAHPGIATHDIRTAAILGDEATVGRFIALDRSQATATGGPLNWDALTHLCFSKYLRLDPSRSDAFVRAATALLDAGASPNAGFYDESHQPEPSFESVLYGAAGVAHHGALTRLLLERGAHPDDEEVCYHVPETYDNEAMQLIVETGKLGDESLMLMLLRKHDWHDYDGVKWLLDRGIDVNKGGWRDRRPLHHAISRDNHVAIIELLLERGADPMHVQDGQSAAAAAARRGRKDVLEAFERRGLPIEWRGVEELIAACARHDADRVRALTAGQPELVSALLKEGADRLAEFAGIGNNEGVRLLLDLGVPIRSIYDNGTHYFGIPKGSMAIHTAAWFLRHETVKLLIDRGSPVDERDGRGRTPLMLVLFASVHSFWTNRRSTDSIEVLLRAGASLDGVTLPSGWDEADALLRR